MRHEKEERFKHNGDVVIKEGFGIADAGLGAVGYFYSVTNCSLPGQPISPMKNELYDKRLKPTTLRKDHHHVLSDMLHSSGLDS